MIDSPSVSRRVFQQPANGETGGFKQLPITGAGASARSPRGRNNSANLREARLESDQVMGARGIGNEDRRISSAAGCMYDGDRAARDAFHRADDTVDGG